MKLYKATFELENKPFTFFLEAKTYSSAEVKVSEILSQVDNSCVRWFFLLDEIKKRRRISLCTLVKSQK
ncbi:MAG: hypothetical protein EB127_18595 [Alphaproteobacteria bacterium]|jgi:hypothetical protein|nr:hypothetical protein [Alphaproteobacteria bacterium]